MSNPRQRQLSLHGYEPTMSQLAYVCMALGFPADGVASVAHEESNPGFTTPDWWPKPSERSFTVSDPWPKHAQRRSPQDHRLLSTSICLDTVCRRTIYTRDTRAVFLAWSGLPKWWGLRADRRMMAWLSWSGYMLKVICREWSGACVTKACFFAWLRSRTLRLNVERRRRVRQEFNGSLVKAILWFWPGRLPTMRNGWNCGYQPTFVSI